MKIKHRLEAAWKALTWEDIIFLGFKDNCSEGCVVSATDKKEIDALAENLTNLLKQEQSTKQV